MLFVAIGFEQHVYYAKRKLFLYVIHRNLPKLALGFGGFQGNSVPVGKNQHFLFDGVTEPGPIQSDLLLFLDLFPELFRWRGVPMLHSGPDLGVC